MNSRFGPRTTVSVNVGETLSGSHVQNSRQEASDTHRNSLRSLLHTVAATWQNSGDGRPCPKTEISGSVHH